MESLNASLQNLDLTSNRGGNRWHAALTMLQTQLGELSTQIELVQAQISAKNTGLEDRDIAVTLIDLKKVINRFQILELQLNDTLAACTGLVENLIMSKILSTGKADPHCRDLVKHFETKINEISHETTMDAAINPNTMFLRVVEECFRETCCGGKLDGDEYFASLEDAALEWPYDRDYQSEEYYEHKDRLAVDEAYAEAHRNRSIRRRQETELKKKAWPRYWSDILQGDPSGPTLFDPQLDTLTLEMPDSPDTGCSILQDMPRYLFRVFDKESSGLNSKTTIASEASRRGNRNSRVDIFKLDRRDASQLLHQHLTKSCSSAEGSDNFVSWTTSLLFAIQYAIWRQHNLKYSVGPESIYICAVDTDNFPRGQFVQDIPLIQAYKNAASGEAMRFFDLRTNCQEFYNGEYLSQGSLEYSGRGHVVSFQSLITSGLYRLYPDFKEEYGFHG